MRRLITICSPLLALGLSLAGEPAASAAIAAAAAGGDTGIRLKDVCEIDGVRDNQIHGVGIVVGLSGTGDKSPATVRMLRQLLTTKNLSFSESDLASKNVAMVAVTADLPAFARSGSRLPTQVSCIGDATSLRGGILLQTPLVAADGRIYAVAQGPVAIGSAGAAGSGGASEYKNIETVGTSTPGALVEREVPTELVVGSRLRLVLREPDFTTARRVSDTLAARFGGDRVSAEDAAVVSLRVPASTSADELTRIISELQQLTVDPDVKARVVINARTGTVVAGHRVSVGSVAVSHAGLNLRVQPKRETIIDPRDPSKVENRTVWTDPVTKIKDPEPPAGTKPSTVPGTFTVIQGATVDEIATALNALGAKPRDLVAIFEAIQRAGALHAELVVM
jgi:flagellar P-ring protein precursor FlgI